MYLSLRTHTQTYLDFHPTPSRVFFRSRFDEIFIFLEISVSVAGANICCDDFCFVMNGGDERRGKCGRQFISSFQKMFAHRPKRNKNVFASECVRKCVVCEFNETYLLHACGEFSTFQVLHTINNISLQTELRLYYVHIFSYAKMLHGLPDVIEHMMEIG